MTVAAVEKKCTSRYKQLYHDIPHAAVAYCPTPASANEDVAANEDWSIKFML